MGNGASTSTTKVISIKTNPEIGKAASDDIEARPVSRMASARERPELASTTALPGAVNDRPPQESRSAQSSKSEGAAQKDRIQLLERSLEAAERKLEQFAGKTILDRTATPEEQWAVICAEMSRLKELGFEFQDQKQAYFEQTCVAQTQLIQRQEREMNTLREEMAKLKEKCERRIKREKNKSAKREAEVSLQVYDLKEQIVRLTDANALLERELASASDHVDSIGSDKKRKPSKRESASGEEEEEAAGGHTMLVLELSSQLSELTDALAEAHATIEELKSARK